MPHLLMVFVPSAKVCKPVVVNIRVCIWVIDHFGPGVPRCLIQTTLEYFFLRHFFLLRNSSQPQKKITTYASKPPQQMPPPSLPLTLPTEKGIFLQNFQSHENRTTHTSLCHIISLLSAAGRLACRSRGNHICALRDESIESGKMLVPTLKVMISPTIPEAELQCVQTKTRESSGWCTAKEQVAENSSASVLYNNGNRVSRDWEKF